MSQIEEGANSMGNALLSTNQVGLNSKIGLRGSIQSSLKPNIVNKGINNDLNDPNNPVPAIIGEESSDKEHSSSSKKPSSDEANPKKIS